MKRILGFSLASVVLALGATVAAHAGVLGSDVSTTDFNSALGAGASGSGQWSYLGHNTSAFTLPGTGTLDLRISTFADSFGYSGTGPSYANSTTVFGSSASVGASAAVTPGFSPFLFWFSADATLHGGNVYDDNTVWTDGHETAPTDPFAWNQGDIEIFKDASTSTWAFFYDDGGPSGSSDDRDYNDLVVTYTAAVPEPVSISLLGAGLLGLGIARRRRSA